MLRIDHAVKQATERCWHACVFLEDDKPSSSINYDKQDIVADTAGHLFVIEDVIVVKYDGAESPKPIYVCLEPVDHLFMPTGALRKPITY